VAKFEEEEFTDMKLNFKTISERHRVVVCKRKCFDIFCRLSTMHERDRQTQIPLAIRTSPSLNFSNTTLKPIISSFHEIPTHVAKCLHVRFKFILNAGALTNLLHYITDRRTDHGTVTSIRIGEVAVSDVA